MTSQPSGRIATTLGNNIRLARVSGRGWTQRELAAALDVDVMLVSKWERGIHRPSDENLIALSRKLQKDLAWLYADHDQVAA